jgi:dihydropteroate synthase
MWRIQYLDLKDPGEAASLFRRIGVHPYGEKAMLPKAEFLHVYLEGIGCSTGNIIKQEMLSLGGEVAVSRGTVDCSSEKTDALVMGTRKQLNALAEKLVLQPFGLRSLGERLSTLLDRLAKDRFVMKTPQRELVFGERTLIMGILNVTPDSFSDGGRYLDAGEAVRRGVRIEEEGADIIDIGGESTRPGSDPVPEAEELERILPVIRELKKRVSIPLSVDTTKASVARAAVEEGAEIINDISALSFDPAMAGAAARAGVPVVLMHIRGVPKTMQQGDLAYGSLMMDILEFLESRIAAAREAGIDEGSILIDPGIGFGKTTEDNLAILLHLKELKTLGRPVLVGPSRKAFIGRITGKDPSNRLAGTAAAVAAAVLNGAHVVRVHDVEFVKDVVRTADAVRGRASA